ncbi:MAG: integrin alpha [Victivallales bacterium]
MLLCLSALIFAVWRCVDKSSRDSSPVTCAPHAAKAQLPVKSDLKAPCNPGKSIRKPEEDVTKTAAMSGALDYVRRDMMALCQSADGASCSNPSQRFNVSLPRTGGFVLATPSETHGAPALWKVGLAPVAWGTENDRIPLGAVESSATGGADPAMPDRLENRFGSGFTEWFVNSDAGVEHGFTIAAAPSGMDTSSGRMMVSLKTTGGTVAVSCDSVGLLADDGSQGDVNGDGYGDVIVGAAGYTSGSCAGKAYVFHGSASGITGTAAAPAWSATGENICIS